VPKGGNVSEEIVEVNRAPVLTLWAAVVAERLGHDRAAALTLGRAVAGLNAQAKGRALGIFRAPPAGARGEPRKVGLGEEFWVDVCGRPVPAKQTSDGVRAVVQAEPIDPGQVEGYLERAFGASLPAVRQAMEALVAAYGPERLEAACYDLYERFRPKIAPGRRGWGQKGALDLGLIRSLAKQA
jgi:hypothetical protein